MHASIYRSTTGWHARVLTDQIDISTQANDYQTGLIPPFPTASAARLRLKQLVRSEWAAWRRVQSGADGPHRRYARRIASTYARL